MSNNNYKRGRAFEYRVMAMCEKAGYTTFRTAGSHGIADIIAIKNTYNTWRWRENMSEILLIQCKYGAKVSKKEREVLFALDLGPQVDIIIAWGGPRKPVVLYNKHGEFKLD